MAGRPEGVAAVMEAIGMEPSRDLAGNVLVERWVRKFDGEKEVRASSATFTMDTGTLVHGYEISIWPSIGDHSLEKHANDALIGSFMFELAQALADRAGGSLVWQKALVGDCEEERGHKNHQLSDGYRRMTQDDICLGFRTVLARGVHQRGQSHEDLGFRDPPIEPVKAPDAPDDYYPAH